MIEKKGFSRLAGYIAGAGAFLGGDIFKTIIFNWFWVVRTTKS